MLVSCAGQVSAQVGVIEPDRAPIPADPRHPAIADFSMQQRAAIYRAILAATKQHSAAVLPFDAQVTVGGLLPDGAPIVSLPDSIRMQIPAATRYEYAVWHDQVLLVDPTNRRIADILHDYVLRNF